MRAAMAAAEVGDDVYGEDPDGQLAGEPRRGSVRTRGGAVRAYRHDGQPDRDPAADAARAGNHLRVALAHSRLGDGDDGGVFRLPDPRRSDQARHAHVEGH